MRLYHFTCPCDDHLGAILKAGELRPSDPNLHGGIRYVERDAGRYDVVGGDSRDTPVVWCVDTPDIGDVSHGLYGEHEKRTVRFTIEASGASPWLKWLTARHHDPKWIDGIVRAGGGKGAARHWWVIPRSVPRAEWVEIRDMRTGDTIEA